MLHQSCARLVQQSGGSSSVKGSSCWGVGAAAGVKEAVVVLYNVLYNTLTNRWWCCKQHRSRQQPLLVGVVVGAAALTGSVEG